MRIQVALCSTHLWFITNEIKVLEIPSIVVFQNAPREAIELHG